MPLDVARLRDSDLAANETPEACWAAVLVWAASWHQVPAASIPNDDKWIAKQAGYAQRGKIAREWAEVRPGALRGWVECSDSRLYHPVVAEKAREAWQAKLKQRWASECARIKKHNDRHPGANVEKPTYEYWMSCGCPTGQPLFVPRDIPSKDGDNTGDNASKGQGEGQRQGDSSTDPYGSGGAAADRKPRTAEQLRKSELWRAIKALLVDSGESKDLKAAGAVVTKAITRFDEPTALAAIEATLHARPAGVIAYLEAACQQATGQRLNKQETLEAGNLAAAERFATEA
jgi:hypothetical protein